MTTPTPAALRAAKEIHPFDAESIQRLTAEKIDEATGLPELIGTIKDLVSHIDHLELLRSKDSGPVPSNLTDFIKEQARAILAKHSA